MVTLSGPFQLERGRHWALHIHLWGLTEKKVICQWEVTSLFISDCVFTSNRIKSGLCTHLLSAKSVRSQFWKWMALNSFLQTQCHQRTPCHESSCLWNYCLGKLADFYELEASLVFIQSTSPIWQIRNQGLMSFPVLLVTSSWLRVSNWVRTISARIFTSFLPHFYTESCLTLCDPMNFSLSGSSLHGIL